LVPDLNPPDVPPAVEEVAHWVCQNTFTNWVYKLFHVETPEHNDPAEAVRSNTQLYHLLCHMHEVAKPLGRVVTRGIAEQQPGPLLFGGCYQAGTGLDPLTQLGFVAGVFRRLIDSQEYVCWTEEGRAEETAYQGWTRWGY